MMRVDAAVTVGGSGDSNCATCCNCSERYADIQIFLNKNTWRQSNDKSLKQL